MCKEFYNEIKDDATQPKPRVGSWVKFKKKNCYAVVVEDCSNGVYWIAYLDGKNEVKEDSAPRFCNVLVHESLFELAAL